MTWAPGPWVLVVGMHRSGTSAVTGALGALGLGVVRVGDRMEWPESNPEHWESLSLTVHNNDLLARLDGAWDAPPPLPPGWERTPEVADAPDPAPLLAAAYPEPGPKVFKDPRLCLLMEYWKKALAGPVAAVLVWRSPMAVARSLLSRDGLPLVEGVALWERYNRSAVEGLGGIDTYVLGYESAVGDRHRAMNGLFGWLGSLPQFAGDARTWDTTAAAEAIVDELHHQPGRGPEDLDALVPPEVAKLEELLSSLAGGHRPLSATPLGPESPWTTSLLRLRQELSGPKRELDATKDLLRITRHELESTKDGMARLHASTSWRITGPLRSVTTAIEALRRPTTDRSGSDTGTGP
jgi:hypothetical protein